MLIVCPSCASEYAIDPAKIGLEGRTVRCAACRSTWFVALETDGIGADEPDFAEPEPDDFGLEEAPPISVEARTGREPSQDLGRKPQPLAPGQSPVKRPGGRLGPFAAFPLGVIAGLLVLVAATLIVARAKVVHLFPQTARLYALAHLPVNLRGLEFRNVKSELVGTGSEAVLEVEGDIANVTRRPASVPPIEIALRNGDGHALYTWTNDPPRQTLDGTETARFRARLASPPAEGRQVFVRFAPASGDLVVARSP